MTQILSNIPSLNPLILAQAGGGNTGNNLLNEYLGASTLGGVIKAIVILILGLIVAVIVKGIVKKILSSTDIDNRIAAAVSGQRGGESIPIESWIANLFFWLIILFTVVAFLEALQLDAVSDPIRNLLDQITGSLPLILKAAIILGITWIVATIVKTLVTKVLGGLNIEQRLGLESGQSANFSLADTLGKALYWFIFLFGILEALNALKLTQVVAPIQGMLDQVLEMIPNILGAALIAAVFWFVANIVKKIVVNLLAATGVDNIGRKVGFSGGAGRQTLSSILGTVVFVLILIPGVIAALERLQISAISEPAISMLDQATDLIPKLFMAGIVLAIFYVVGKLVAEFVSDFLTSIGFDNVLQWLGINTATSGTDATPGGSPLGSGLNEPVELGKGTEQPTRIQTGSSVSTKTPSDIVGLLCLVSIMLVASLTAVDILGIAALKDVVSIILAIAGQVLIGVVVFAIGLYLANFAFNLIVSSGTSQSRFLGQCARIAIITLVGAMALNRMGIAPNIVNLAFGLILGGIAVAIALAFGLGGREVAREELKSWIGSFKGK